MMEPIREKAGGPAAVLCAIAIAGVTTLGLFGDGPLAGLALKACSGLRPHWWS